MKRIIIGTALSFAASMIALACGSDGTSGNAPASGGGASNGGADNGGATSNGGEATNNGGGSNGGTSNGGATSNGGTSNGGATGGNCDMSACPPRTFGQVTLASCCIDAATCGNSSAQIMGGTCFQIPAFDAGAFNEPIALDPNCPDFELPEGGLGGGVPFDAGSANSFAGCCDKTNVCGFAFSRSFGGADISLCVTPADAARFGQGGGAIDAGPAVPCTYKAP